VDCGDSDCENDPKCKDCPTITGQYFGSYTSEYSNCDNPDDEDIDIWNPPVEINIDTQNDCTFSGSATATFSAEVYINDEWKTVYVYDEITFSNGTINADGEISGNSSYILQEHIGEGTFTGQLSDSKLNITITGHDSLGCDYTKWIITEK